MKRHEDWLKEQLQAPAFSAEYLNAAAEDPEPAVHLRALRMVAEAQGIAQVAAAAGIPPKRISRALSATGDPRWSTLSAILRATGMKVTVSRAP